MTGSVKRRGASAGRERVARHRAAMRRKGMRLMQMWVPDTRSPAFAEEARLQSAAVDRLDHDDDILEFLEHVNYIDNPD